MMKQQPYHHGDLPNALRKVAWDMVDELGMRGLSLRECARRAGVSHAAPAHYFKSLDGLILELAADGYMRMVEYISLHQTDPSPLIGVGLGYIEFAEKHPEQFRLMQSLGPTRGKSARLQTASNSAMTCLENALRSAWCTENGSEPPPDLLHRRVLLAWSAVHGYACLVIDQRISETSLAPPAEVLQPLLLALLTP